MIIKGGKMSEAIQSIFKNEKISVGILLMIIPMLIAAKSWADTEYVLQDDFEKLTETIDTHVTEFQAAREEQRIEAREEMVKARAEHPKATMKEILQLIQKDNGGIR